MGLGLQDVFLPGSSYLEDALNPGTTTQDQVPLLTPQQRQAQQMLANFMNTGKFGDFTAGADIGIKPGDYNMTGLETTGQSQLQQLLSSGIPNQYRMGDTALASILSSNPADVSAQFDPFKQQVQRQIDQSNRDLTRNAGFAGNLYSTNTIRNLGDIQARGNETLTAQLASLTNEALNRRLQAIPLAYQSGQAQENLAQNRIASAYQYGALPRTLANAATDAANQELLRRRQELLLPLNAATSLSNANVQFGVPSVTTQNPNPMLDLLTAVISGGSRIIGSKGAG